MNTRFVTVIVLALCLTSFSQDGVRVVKSEFVFEKVGDPWTKSTLYMAHAGSEWKRFDWPFTARESYGAGGAHVCSGDARHSCSAATRTTVPSSSARASASPPCVWVA